MRASSARLILRFVASLAAFLGLIGLVIGLGAWLLNPPTGDLVALAVFLLVSGGISLAAAYAALLLGHGKLLRTVRAKLLFALLLSAGLVLVNVGFTAHLMFLSPHDLTLLSLLMLFSVGISVFVATAIAHTFHGTLQALMQAVHAMSTGQLDTRVAVRSSDELAELARAFDAMASELEAAAARQHDLEQARRQLVAAISHDLRTPLATMRAMVESINDGVVSDPETVRRYLQTLQGEIEYLSRLIDDLFELSQIDAGLLRLHLEPADLSDLISDTLEATSAQARQRQLTLMGEIDEALPVVMDTRRVQRVLYNLLQNALRHTPADGSIVIKAVDAGTEVRVSVADTGEGIAADELPKIFDRFHRGDKARARSQGGSGLGLSIAKGIVELHGGSIWAESGPGSGATFTFALPKG